MKSKNSLVDLHLEIIKERKKYFKDSYFKKIKLIAKKILKDENIELLVFGSFVKNKIHPLSDIDIMIISKEPTVENWVKLKGEIDRKFKNNPFEIHLINKEMWEKWYKKFCSEFRRI